MRHPLFPARAETLIEAEIYTRLLEKMGELPKSFPILSRIAKNEPDFSRHAGFIAALAATLAVNKKWIRYGASILYRTLGATLEGDAAAITLLLPLSISLAQKHPEAVRRAGHDGNKLTQGVNLFNAILKARSGLIFSEHTYDDVWRLVKNPQKKITLAIPELLEEMDKLTIDDLTSEDYPFILSAGERRSYNANQIYRNPKWRKIDHDGFMRMHPKDAERLGLVQGDSVKCQSENGVIEAMIELDESVRSGYLMMPHGYGSDYQNGKVNGPKINQITGLEHCDPIHKTPLHKTIPVNIEKLSA